MTTLQVDVPFGYKKHFALRPDRSSSPIEQPKLVKTKKVKAMSFETALRHLRSGKRVRRRMWNAQSAIFRLGDKVFAKLPDSFAGRQELPAPSEKYGSRPDFWKPYPSDFLASDWEVAK